MIVGQRIAVMLKEQRITQSELARRAKVSQPLISGLIRGSVISTSRLHRIARELGTTPAYLTGDVDDPDLDAPEPPIISVAELEWVEIYRSLDERSRAALFQVGRTMVAGVASHKKLPNLGNDESIGPARIISAEEDGVE